MAWRFYREKEGEKDTRFESLYGEHVPNLPQLLRWLPTRDLRVRACAFVNPLTAKKLQSLLKAEDDGDADPCVLRSIDMLHSIFEEWEQSSKHRLELFCRFVTGMPNVDEAIYVGRQMEGRLPQAHTCHFLIKVDPTSDRKSLKSGLEKSITETAMLME
uniref:HECT domain-containing protein n=1 Tax=Lotharella globosa TaxID=91324 RepID=A0A7S4DTX4_9EUKA|mmetsp:Transcript_14791/g.27888  ORF Transcript_14791/g.27888 Transcript_14791/m.27888 type:complete len:159 (+) Transcript_14791:245-721(+)